MQSETTEIAVLIALSTAIFLLMPVMLIFYIKISIKYRKNHLLEKNAMQQRFESEMLQAKVEVQDQTMQAIATELHDNVGQLLSLTTLHLNSVQLSDTEKAGKKIENALSLVTKSIKELRELAKLLHGEQIVSHGIGHAIEKEMNWLEKSGAYQLNISNKLLDLEHAAPDKDLIILRLLQEVLNNIIKHARATRIHLECYYEQNILFLNIKENGVGFDVEQVRGQKSGMGLDTLFKRIEMINGRLNLNSLPEQGTAIFIEIPYP